MGDEWRDPPPAASEVEAVRGWHCCGSGPCVLQAGYVACQSGLRALEAERDEWKKLAEGRGQDLADLGIRYAEFLEAAKSDKTPHVVLEGETFVCRACVLAAATPTEDE